MDNEVQSSYGTPLGFLYKLDVNHFVYKCSGCDEEFVNGYDLEQHVVQHESDDANIWNIIKSEVADFPVATDDHDVEFLEIPDIIKSELDYESDIVIIEEPDMELKSDTEEDDGYTCDICQQKFISYARIKRHLLHHPRPQVKKPRKLTKPKKQKIPCKLCDRFTVNMDMHMRQFHLCIFCGETYRELKELINHKLSNHRGQRKYVCEHDECDKAFYDVTSLRDHTNVHHRNLKMFLCDICAKSFGTRKHLRQHLLSHGEKTFKCKFCEAKFATTTGRLQHEKWNHLGIKRQPKKKSKT